MILTSVPEKCRDLWISTGGVICVFWVKKNKETPAEDRAHALLCEALSCDSLMTNPQAGLSLLSVLVQEVSGIRERFLLHCFLSVLVTLLKIVPLTVTEETRQLISHVRPRCKTTVTTRVMLKLSSISFRAARGQKYSEVS